MKKRRVLIILFGLTRNADPRIKTFFVVTKNSPPSLIDWMRIDGVEEHVLVALRKKIKKKHFSQVRILYKERAEYTLHAPRVKDVFFEKIECVSFYLLDSHGNGWDALESSVLPPISRTGR